jgi:hypothetical protein
MIDTAKQALLGRRTTTDFDREAQEFDARKKQRELQQQILTRKLNQADDLDLAKVAEKSIFDMYQGKPLDDRGRAAIQTLARMQSNKTVYKPDEFGNVRAVTQPNPYESFLSGVDDGRLKPGNISKSQLPTYNQIQPQMDMPQNAIPQMPAIDPTDPMMMQHAQSVMEAQQGVPGPNQRPDLAMQIDPRAMTAPKVQMDVAKDIMSLPVEQQRLQIQNQAELEQQKALAQQESELARPAEQKRLENILRGSFVDARNINSVIDKSIEESGVLTAGMGGAVMRNWPGSGAVDLAENLKTIEADAAFTRLQEMRDNSKTGGALGQVSERELGLLSAARAALSVEQSPAQLRENLLRYKSVRQTALDNVKRAFIEDYGYTPDGLESNFEKGGIETLIEQYTR